MNSRRSKSRGIFQLFAIVFLIAMSLSVGACEQNWQDDSSPESQIEWLYFNPWATWFYKNHLNFSGVVSEIEQGRKPKNFPESNESHGDDFGDNPILACNLQLHRERPDDVQYAKEHDKELKLLSLVWMYCEGCCGKKEKGFSYSQVESLLREGVNPNFKRPKHRISNHRIDMPRRGFTPLHIAVCRDNEEMMKLLVKYEADPFEKDAKDLSVFDWIYGSNISKQFNEARQRAVKEALSKSGGFDVRDCT